MEIPKFDPNNIEGSIEMPLDGRIVETVDRHGMQQIDENGLSYADRMDAAYGAGNWQVRTKDPQHFTEAERAQYELGMDLVDIVVSDSGDAFVENSTRDEEPAPTFNQIDQQLATTRVATVLVERSSGDVTTGQIMGYGEHGSRVFFGNITSNLPDKKFPTRTVSAEKLTDAHQQLLAEKLAGIALREVEKPTPLSDTEIEILNLERSIKDAQSEKQRAQQEGRGNDSTYWGQVAGQYSKELRALRSK